MFVLCLECYIIVLCNSTATKHYTKYLSYEYSYNKLLLTVIKVDLIIYDIDVTDMCSGTLCK